jgi:NAD(P)-dependent dehydrogenase (short-subunit alcohol dehydrogenase family)
VLRRSPYHSGNVFPRQAQASRQSNRGRFRAVPSVGALITGLATPQIAGMTALGRLGEANDVGAVIAAVLSDDFRWVTGQHIEASGGARLSVAS